MVFSLLLLLLLMVIAATRATTRIIIIYLVHVAAAAVAMCACNIKMDPTHGSCQYGKAQVPINLTLSCSLYLSFYLPPPLLEAIADEEEPKYVPLDGRDVAMALLLPLLLRDSTAPGAELK